MPQGGHPPHHSITSSARKRIDVGNTIPKLFAVFRLMTSSNVVGNSARNSAALAPRSTLAARAAPCRKFLFESTPYEIIPPARAKSGNSETAGSRSPKSRDTFGISTEDRRRQHEQRIHAL